MIAIAIGGTVFIMEAYLVGYLDYLLSAFADEAGPMLLNMLLVSTPFLLLAKRRITSQRPWAVGRSLTLLVHGYVILKHMTGGFAGGTSVGNSMWLALVSLGSTVAITIICAILTKRRAPPKASGG